MKNKSLKQAPPLKETLFKRIETEGVEPRSRILFRCHECMVWFFWVMSIVVGAFAVAISLFVITHRQYELYEATHDNFFTFVVDALPYLWIVVFGLMIFLAVYNFRHTKRGYRQSPVLLVLSSVVLSFAAGSAMQLFGMGYTVDDLLGKNMVFYMSQEKLESRIWQAPEEGRLLGRQVFSTLSPTSTIVFEDSTGKRWGINVRELLVRDLELLSEGKTVRLLGKAKNQELRLFHACGVFPWMVDKNVTRGEMSAEREAFMRSVYEHAKRAEDRLIQLEGRTFGSARLSEESICGGIAAVRKIPVSAHSKMSSEQTN